ncbi:DUF433 domain-containing protein [Methylomonas koyamae]
MKYEQCYYLANSILQARQLIMTTLSDRITINADICHGKPCVRGLRYPVETVLEWLSAGMTHEEILADYPDLEHEDILAVLAFATRLAQVKRIDALAA